MRRVIRAALRVILRVFFPHIELAGLDRIPVSGPVIFVVNHPNGLIDPLFLLCLLPRPVSFLAKAPLFRMPVVSWFVRAFGSIPVYRRQDGTYTPERNLETFEQARSVLARGGGIALFPEGTSHSYPRMRPLKTGAARIALGATAVGGNGESTVIVPVGIYYTAKGIFRSGAVLYCGDPIPVTAGGLDEDGEPPAGEVRALTARIERALSDVTLQADEREALALAARAEEVLSSGDSSSTGELPATERLVEQFEVRRRILAGYATLNVRHPERVASLSARITRYQAELGESGLDPETLTPRVTGSAQVLREFFKAFLLVVVALPIAALGVLINYPAYRLVGFIATGLSRGEDDVVATIKVLAGALLFLLTWIAIAIFVGAWRGALSGFLALLIAPLSGYAALLFFEKLDDMIGGFRAVILSRFRRWGYLQLLAERRAIRDEILKLGAELET